MIGQEKAMDEIKKGTDSIINCEYSRIYIELWYKLLRSKSEAFKMGFIPHSQSFNADFLKNNRAKLEEFKNLFSILKKEVGIIRIKTKAIK